MSTCSHGSARRYCRMSCSLRGHRRQSSSGGESNVRHRVSSSGASRPRPHPRWPHCKQCNNGNLRSMRYRARACGGAHRYRKNSPSRKPRTKARNSRRATVRLSRDERSRAEPSRWLENEMDPVSHSDMAPRVGALRCKVAPFGRGRAEVVGRQVQTIKRRGQPPTRTHDPGHCPAQLGAPGAIHESPAVPAIVWGGVAA